MTTEINEPTDQPGADEAKTPDGEQSEPQDGTQNAEENAGNEEKDSSDDGLDSLPESWQAEIRKLRSENAKHRTSNKELKDRLEAAKSPEDFEALKSETQATIAKLERDLSIAKHTQGLDPDLVEFVTGDTDEEIKASADKVRALLGRNQGSDSTPGGGMRPDSDDGPLDPKKLAAASRAANRRL